MSPRRPDLRLDDILGAISDIRGFIDGVGRDEFLSNKRVQYCVLMAVLIIGEACAALPEDLTQQHPHIEWSKIRRTRNIIVHVYHGVELRVIWDIVLNHLGPLEAAIRTMKAGQHGKGATDVD